MVVYIHKVIMILYCEFTPIEYRVMMMRVNYFYSFFSSYSSICFLLLSKLPNINIPTRSMVRLWPIQRTSITFQNHHLQPMRVVEACHFYNSLPIGIISIFISLQDFTYPFQQQLLWRPLLCWKFLNSIEDYSI